MIADSKEHVVEAVAVAVGYCSVAAVAVVTEPFLTTGRGKNKKIKTNQRLRHRKTMMFMIILIQEHLKAGKGKNTTTTNVGTTIFADVSQIDSEKENLNQHFCIPTS